MTKRLARIASSQVRETVKWLEVVLPEAQEVESGGVSHRLVTTRREPKPGKLLRA
jgi:hypothetical protein